MPQEWTYDLFISYAEEDKAWVEGYLIDALEKSNVHCYSEADFALGVPRLEQIEKGIEQSKRTLLVISPAYLADLASENRFTEALAFKHDRETSTWSVIPLIRHPVPKLPGILGTIECLKATNETEQEVALRRLSRELQVSLAAAEAKPPCPYPGIEPFRENNHELFFGRDRDIKEALQRLKFHAFLTIIGPSGSGKSSLAFAGVLPELRDSQLFETDRWLSVALRPREHPLVALRRKLASDSTDVEMAVSKLLNRHNAQNLILIVDQFEELFTVADPEEVEPFQILLQQLSQLPNCYVILTVRADFYEDLMLSPLWTEIRGHRLEVLPLDEEGLKEAIVNPADVVGVYIESALVERLIADALGASQEPGVLPLLQVTLEFLWERIERRFLPLSAYEDLAMVLPRSAYGIHPTGLQAAIARLAEEALAELTQTQEAIARRIFLRLVQFGQGRPDTRRQQPLEALRSIGEKQQDFQKTLDTLVKYRLLTVTSEEDEQDKKVDISHDAIINGWSTLPEWIQERKDAEQMRRRLESQAQEWMHLGQGKGGLLDAIELAGAERWLESSDAQELGYSPSLINLVTASRQAIAEAERLEQERQQREYNLIKERLEQEQKARKAEQLKNRVAVGSLSTILVVSSIAGIFSWQQQQQTLRARQVFYDLSLGVPVPTPELISMLPELLEEAKQLSQQDEEVERSIAYYAQILRQIQKLQKTSQELSQSQRETIKEVLQAAKPSVITLIKKEHITLLQQQLDKGRVGERVSNIHADLEKQFTDALQTTYKILMLDTGADINRDGNLDSLDEIELIPCEILLQVQDKWQVETQNRCSFRGQDGVFSKSPHCQELGEENLTTTLFAFPPSQSLLNQRLQACENQTS